jgi:hypothetical protein
LASEKGLVMRAVIWIVAIFGILFGGYWFGGSWAIQAGAKQVFAQQTAQGMVASYTDLGVSGFPTRFNLTLDGLDIGNPVTGVRWQTPQLQVMAATWKPWQVIAVLDQDQVIDLPDQKISVSLIDGRASVTVLPDTTLGLSRLAASATGVVVGSDAGWRMAANVVEAHTALDATSNVAHTFTVDATDVLPDAAVISATGLDATISKIRLAGMATFSAPLDRTAGETQPRLVGFRLDEGQLDWGDLQVTAKGDIAPGADGLAEGRIDISITGWRKIVPALVGAGAIKPEIAPTVEGMLGAMAAQGGDPEVLMVPLVYTNGRGTLGPLPLGPAPRLN